MDVDQISKEIDRCTEQIRFEEAQSEKRIQFFLTITGASITLIGLFNRWDVLKNETEIFSSALTISIVLFIYGLHTLNRLNWRRFYIQTDINHIKESYELLAQIYPYYTKVMNWQIVNDDRIDGQNWFFYTVRGSPAEFMYITNALIVAGGIYSLERLDKSIVHIGVLYLPIVLSVGAGSLCWWYMAWRKLKFFPEIKLFKIHDAHI